MTIRGRSLVALVVVLLFLAGQTCLLPIPSGASTTPAENGHPHSAAPAPSSSDSHGHDHGPGVSAHCADSAVGYAPAPRVHVVATILVSSAPILFPLRMAVRMLDTPADVGGPPRFLLHVSLLI